MSFDISQKFLSENEIKNEIKYTAICQTNAFENPTTNIMGWRNHSSSSPDQLVVTNSNYNSNNGYGLVNAGLAVSKAAGDGPYEDVPDLGGNNWSADLINAPTVWNKGYTGKGVIVAVIDTGVDFNHEDLKNNIWINTKEIAGNGIDDDGNGYIDDVRGWNFDNNNNNVLDNNGHGTHVSGTIAAENNGIGVVGIAYNSQIMSVKALDANGSGSYANITKGIYYAVDNGAKVINLSLGGNSSNDSLKSAIEYASNKGVIVVMAAGNNSESIPSYPARYAYNSGIAVGAVDQNNNLAKFSNRSGSQEIAYITAPGVNIYSTVPNNQYANYSGTSMAAPHIVGVVALMLGANPNLTESQVRQILTMTSANSTSSTEPTTPTQPGLEFPSFFPPLDSFFPLELTKIISQLPLSFQTTSPPILQQFDYYSQEQANPFGTRLTLQYYESGKAPCQNETDRLYNLNAEQMR